MLKIFRIMGELSREAHPKIGEDVPTVLVWAIKTPSTKFGRKIGLDTYYITEGLTPVEAGDTMNSFEVGDKVIAFGLTIPRRKYGEDGGIVLLFEWLLIRARYLPRMIRDRFIEERVGGNIYLRS